MARCRFAPATSIYHDLAGFLKNFNNFASSPPYGYTYNPPAPASITDPYAGVAVFPYDKPQPGSGTARFPSTPMTLLSFSPDFNAGRAHQWNAGYEWEPFKNYLITASYVGSRGTHLVSCVNINQPIFIPGASTNANQQSRRPFPQFNAINEAFSGTNSRYNALQLTLNKRFARGFSLLANYTLGRSTEDGDPVGIFGSAAGYRVQGNRALDYGVSDYDRPQVFSVAYGWDLPFPSTSHTWVRRAFGYWTLGGILRASSGSPLKITSPSTFNVQSAGAWANYVGGEIYTDHSTRASQAYRWVNPLAFCPANASGPTCTVDPKAGVDYLAVGNVARDIARGPGGLSNDMSLSKRVPLSDRWGAMEFRVAAFNVFNHTVLGVPDTNTANRATTFGQINGTAVPSRNLQLALRYSF